MMTQDTTAVWPNLMTIQPMSSIANPIEAVQVNRVQQTSALTLGHLTWQPETNQVQLHLALDLMGLLTYHGAGLSQIKNSGFNDEFIIKIPNAHQPGIHFDEPNAQFFIDGKPVPQCLLTELEHELLKYLYDNIERVCTYHQIATNVWCGWAECNTIARQISNLRQKLRKISPTAQKGYIETCRGYRRGYMLRQG